jgi:hypothetical protein
MTSDALSGPSSMSRPTAADPDKLVPVADAGDGDVEQEVACGRRRQLVHLEDLDGLAACRDFTVTLPTRAKYSELALTLW